MLSATRRRAAIFVLVVAAIVPCAFAGGCSSSSRPPTTSGASSGHATLTDGSVPPSLPCADYCTCLDGLCRKVAGYPFAADAGTTCGVACARQDAKRTACWGTFCQQAARYTADSADRQHFCEHAWGLYDVEECP